MDEKKRLPILHRPVSDYALDASSWSPEEIQIEALTFELRIAAGAPGTVAFETPSQRVTPGFFFIFDKLIASAEKPTEDPENLVKVNFNILNQGRNKAVFKTPLNMSVLVSPVGPAHMLEWKTAFRFYESADISIDWTVDLANWANTKRFFVTLLGAVVRDKLIGADKR